MKNNFYFKTEEAFKKAIYKNSACLIADGNDLTFKDTFSNTYFYVEIGNTEDKSKKCVGKMIVTQDEYDKLTYEE